TVENLAVVQRLAIPSIDVDAPVIEVGLDADGAMEVPDRPDVVGWYAFTAPPGTGGNAAFAAHVNWHTGEYAAFSALSDVTTGDEVVLTLEGGATLRYRVTERLTVDALTTDADEVIGDLGVEAITLITCHGTY